MIWQVVVLRPGGLGEREAQFEFSKNHNATIL